MVSTPVGRPVAVTAGGKAAEWFGPRTGATTVAGGVFAPPTAGDGNDWALVLTP